MDKIHDKFFSEVFLDEALKEPKIVKGDKDWLTHSIPYIAAVKTRDKSLKLSSLYTALAEDTTYVVNGNKVPTSSIRKIYKLLGDVNRSEIVKQTMKEAPHYSSAVPWALYAFKTTYGVEYDAWEFDHIRMRELVLGKQLANYFQVQQYVNTINDDVIYHSEQSGERGLQEYFEEIGIKNFDMKRYDFFDPAQRRIWRDMYTEEGMVDPLAYMKLNPNNIAPKGHKLRPALLDKFYWCMITQTWIFEPRIRADNMVTSLKGLSVFDEPLFDTKVNDIHGGDLW